MLGPIITGLGRDDLGGCGAAARVSVLGERLRIPPPGDNVAENPHAGHPDDIADHERQLYIHLDERLLHPLDMAARALDQVSRCRK